LDRGAEIFTASLVIWFRETNFVINEKKTTRNQEVIQGTRKKGGPLQVILQQSIINFISHLFLPEQSGKSKKTTADEIFIFKVKKPKEALTYDRKHFLYFVKTA
jgi:hypothetical protein